MVAALVLVGDLFLGKDKRGLFDAAAARGGGPVCGKGRAVGSACLAQVDLI